MDMLSDLILVDEKVVMLKIHLNVTTKHKNKETQSHSYTFNVA